MNVYEDSLKKLNSVALLLKEDLSFLQQPEKIIITSFPTRIKGMIKYFTGYRVQYNSLLGPYKGGLRFTTNVDLNEIKALALWMTIKNSLAGIPYGGSKGGVTIDTKSLNNEELELITRCFTRSIAKDIGSNIDVPAPDVYTNSQVMSWLLDEYETIKGYHEPGVVTGKPLVLGGSLVRNESTALGAFFIIKNISSKSNVIVQGFGNVGLNLALMLYKNGYKIIGVSDSRSGVYSNEGINIPELINHKNNTGGVKDFKLAHNITNEELLELDTNILVPAAVENMITEKNADKIKAKIIVEVANGPINNEADKILEKKGVLVYPDVLCNAGGVIVSYYEWVQNNQGFYWIESELIDKLKIKMISNLELVVKESEKLNCSLRQGAYALAIKRLIEAKKLRGH
ncbi:MAG: Glu/Leu/Phe/Val dehydrogenase [Candidatus Nanoarchaeia archaeon]|jgi:glutamate dehydrogenase/leucine dehydrogenase